MPDNPGTPGGEHLEELLSQLKGIFGHLSETDQEEAKQKIMPPPAAGPPPAVPPADPPLPIAEASLSPTPPAIPKEEPVEVAPPAPVELAPPPAPPSSVDPMALPRETFTAHEATVPEGASLLPAAIFYPAGKIQEAKNLAERVERIAPKFTKVTFVINVQILGDYDAKSDLNQIIPSQLQNTPIKAAFLLIEKPIDEARRKALIAQLEPRGIYFQEIPLQQIEKKAVYTDMLLGMVFFFDSQKTAQGGSHE